MPRFFLKQPDGKLAMFSTVSDDFTYYDMDDAEALDLGVEEFGRETAKEMISRARDDMDYREDGNPDDGLHGWRHALTSIAMYHGLDKLKARMEELGFGDLPVPQKAIEVAEEIAVDRARHQASR